ncbi:MAG: transglycosylase domain-containing protein [Clostridia bacterium]
MCGIIKEAKLTAKDFAIKNENSIVLDKDGNKIAELSGTENRKYVSISEMAPYLPEAYIAIEDERFRDHMGFRCKKNFCCNSKVCI